ncbi:hypothetical protein Emed_005757 [Eimeria media]
MAQIPKRGPNAPTREEEDEGMRLAEVAGEQVERDTKNLCSPAAAVLLRTARKHYKGYRDAQKKLLIKHLRNQLEKKANNPVRGGFMAGNTPDDRRPAGAFAPQTQSRRPSASLRPK